MVEFLFLKFLLIFLIFQYIIAGRNKVPLTLIEASGTYLMVLSPHHISALKGTTEHTSGTVGRELSDRLPELKRLCLRREEKVHVLLPGNPEGRACPQWGPGWTAATSPRGYPPASKGLRWLWLSARGEHLTFSISSKSSQTSKGRSFS